MKKLSLICFAICIVLLLFMVRIAFSETIDVGDLAEEYGTWIGNNYSLMSRGNPANATGTIDHIEMYVSSIGSGDKVTVYALTEVASGEFDSGGSSGEFTVVVGTNIFNAPGDFVAFAITAGDFIGCYTTCALKRDTSGGSDVLLDYGQEFPMDNFTFGSTYTEDKLALYGTGTTGEPPPTAKPVQSQILILE